MSESVVSYELGRARQLLHAEVKEADFQRDVLAAARLLNWRCYHTLDSRGSAAGFPDLVMVRGSRLVMAEPKREKGRVSDAQQTWLDDLGPRLRRLTRFCGDRATGRAVEDVLR